ncbi:cell division protein FtsZ [Methylocystis sp. MJC1]|jgi:cell division protein FtsZ|uniref:cell division protein FtsZ n=1 Tax=Methylocystis sp. MJC1 TaxID=2654282 RepID=UPI0013EA7F20|nr:cell division protein FtsZ [Methylocystis sp. MJC1]KAF2989489.1 Cell division protein FtsZ [Methylocystis sp. MJC1]MBU6527921.1 cell division protein FtsZ [Methylocystis sp. MJC1]UZX10841.1 cell division protein FtsZ [Methylocystis sp. MJC1]
MTINLKAPELRELKPRIMVCGVGGGGCNAVNNMITSGLSGVDFLVANTDAQALASSSAERVIQMGLQVTEGLGAGAQPEVGRAAAEEAREEIREHLQGAHMCFVTAGMGGGTGTGAAPVIAQIAREMGILTVGVVTKPFHFEGQRRLRIADAGITELQKCVDTLIVIPNQNLFRIATEKTTFADAFAMADQVLYSGVASVTDLMVKEGLINLDFADVRSIMRGMGKAMMGTGEATGERRANLAAEAAIANPLLDEVSMKGARGLLISITGGDDLTLYEVDEAASRIRQEVDEDANIILGATFDSSLEGVIRVSVVATGIDLAAITAEDPTSQSRMAEAAERLRQQLHSKPQSASAPVAEAAPSAQIYAMSERAAPAYQPEMREAAPAPAYYAEPAPAAPAHMTTNGVYLEQVAARPAYVEPMPEPASRMAMEPAPAPYVPPAPEMPRTPRMPSIEDFPKPVQDQIRQHHAEASQDPRRKSIFERLASFGASRQEDAMQDAPAAPYPQAPMPPRAPQPSPAHAEYGKRPAAPAPQAPGHAGLDAHGRRAPAARPVEEDHLEIPAFLRRQSNH